jgi:2-oxoglutarate dehydrogenase complex dihydrolipoamide succinyltransferase (E2) component
MAISIVVPQLGESVAEGTVAKWLKAVGDKVRKEEPLVEIQTDKINVEIPSPAEGTLSSITVPEGTTVLVGTEIGQIGALGEATAAPVAAAAAKAAAAAGAPGQAKAAPAPAAPARVAVAASAPAPVAAYGGSGNGNAQNIESGEGRNLSPAVRKIMREQNVSMTELGAIAGSGVAGRVTRDDLLDYLKRRGTAPASLPSAPMPTAARSAAPVAAAPLPSFLQPAAVGGGAAGPRETTIPFSRVRKVIAENMIKAKHTAAHTHCFDECDMSAIVALRKEWAPKLEAQGIKLTYMPFFIKAAVFALKEFPWVNGSVSPQGDAMIVKHYYNIGMAVGRDDKGLIVPNLKDCDRKNLVQLANEVNDLAARARADRLNPDDIQGGTFSITNAGVFGAINSSPVINVPEVAILGVHKIVERPVVKHGQIVAAQMMNAAIGFDHRVVDGELAVKFLRRVCELLEKPELLWFHT